MTAREPVALHDAEADVLAGALARLDELLGRALEADRQRAGGILSDPTRGMALAPAAALALLEQPPVLSPMENADTWLADAIRLSPRWQQLARVLELDARDLALLLLLLAPDLDPRYARLYGYLQDDLTRRRPCADLLAGLLAGTAAERLDVLRRLRGPSRLHTHGLIADTGPGKPAGTPCWSAQGLRIDASWQHWLHGLPGIDASCARFARLVGYDTVSQRPRTLGPALADDAVLLILRRLIDQTQRGLATPRLMLDGPHGAGKLALAHAFAQALDLSLLAVDVHQAEDAPDLQAIWSRSVRAARLTAALPCIHGSLNLAQRDPALLQLLARALARHEGPFIVLRSAPWPQLHGDQPIDALQLPLPLPGTARRAALWTQALQERGLPIDAAALTTAAARFALSGAQIAQAAADLAASRCLIPTHDAAEPLGITALAAAARAQSAAPLRALARRITPRADFATLVCPADVLAQLGDICARMATREQVRAQYAGSTHGRLAGVSALFVGASGTGKTLAAEAVAGELALDLMHIDLAGVVSKYIGETEKNLAQVFGAARNANAVLFFDEADALFGKRSEVKDARDRYANIEVAYLLQKMEQFDGLAILATNLRNNLDEAFARRLSFCVHFPFPEADERQRLWRAVWPARAEPADDVDLDWFAQEYRLSGGQIRNIVLAAAHLAATQGGPITRAQLVYATRREYQKLGRNLAPPPVAATLVGST